MPWLDLFRTLYPVVVTLLSLAGLLVTLWLGSRFVGKADYATMAARVADLETRITVVEEHGETGPSRTELRDEIATLAERLSAVEASIAGFARQLETTNSYLHSLIATELTQTRKR